MSSTVSINKKVLPILCMKEIKKKNLELDEKFHQIEIDSGTLTFGDSQFNNVVLEELEYCGILGQGACGVVTKRVYKGHTFAVKEMKRTNSLEEMKRILMDLYVIRQSYGNPNTVQYLGYILTSEDLFICMELMNICLEQMMKKIGHGFPESILGKVTVSVVNGLNYLFGTLISIMHRDIKPSNMLIDTHGNIKLCDFGIAGQLIEYLPPSVTMGCISYMAPERIERKPYDIRSDVWSLGISLVYLARYEFPYEQDTQFGVMLRILNNPEPRLNGKDTNFSAEFYHFVERCLQKDMEKRANYVELFAHRFYRQNEEKHVDVASWYHGYMDK